MLRIVLACGDVISAERTAEDYYECRYHGWNYGTPLDRELRVVCSHCRYVRWFGYETTAAQAASARHANRTGHVVFIVWDNPANPAPIRGLTERGTALRLALTDTPLPLEDSNHE